MSQYNYSYYRFIRDLTNNFKNNYSLGFNQVASQDTFEYSIINKKPLDKSLKHCCVFKKQILKNENLTQELCDSDKITAKIIQKVKKYDVSNNKNIDGYYNNSNITMNEYYLKFIFKDIPNNENETTIDLDFDIKLNKIIGLIVIEEYNISIQDYFCCFRFAKNLKTLYFELYITDKYFCKLVEKYQELKCTGDTSYKYIYKYILHLDDINKLNSYQYYDDFMKFDEAEIIVNDDFYNEYNLYKSTLNLNLYDYQISNVNWIYNFEKNIRENKLKVFNFYKNKLIFIEKNNKKFYYDFDNHSFFNKKSKLNDLCIKLKINGGVLADQVGLGKTATFISFLVKNKINNQNKNPTLILFPRRLFEQWIQEINKFVENKFFKILIIKNIRDYKLINFNEITKYDLILTSYDFLTGQSFSINTYYNYRDFLKLNFDRIIFDEGHEFLNTLELKLYNRNTFCKIIKYIKKNKAIKWICSATPFIDTISLTNLLSLIFNLEFDNYECKNELFEKIIIKNKDLLELKKIIRFNTTKVLENIYTPKLKFENILLDFTSIEKAIYKNAEKSNDLDRLFQLCTNIFVSSTDNNLINFDGEELLSLDKVNEKMIFKFSKLRKILTERLEKLNEKLISKTNHYTKRIEANNFETEDHKSLFKKKYEKDKIVLNEKITETQNKINYYDKQITIFKDNFIEETVSEPCPICIDNIDIAVITNCRHIYCKNCIDTMFERSNNQPINCPYCRTPIVKNEITYIDITKDKPKNECKENNIEEDKENLELNKYGTKLANLKQSIQDVLENTDERIIIFSRWDKMLLLVSKMLKEFNIKYLRCGGNTNVINNIIGKFKTDKTFRIILLSSETCTSGNNLTEASRIYLLDTIQKNKYETISMENQAIGRAVRLGQDREVVIKRFIMKNTIEEHYFNENKVGENINNILN